MFYWQNFLLKIQESHGLGIMKNPVYFQFMRHFVALIVILMADFNPLGRRMPDG